MRPPSIGSTRCMIFADERKTLAKLQDMYDRAIDSELAPTESNVRRYEAYLYELTRLIAEAGKR